MEPAKRIIINTLAQHIRSVINICLSLYSTRLVLQALGQSDFGIYSLIAGVVAMLGFLTNAMVVTTQRQLSFYHGRGNIDEVKKMFSNSLLLHIIVMVIIGALLMAIRPILFNGFLEIEPERLETASFIYGVVILTLLITFYTAPFRALFVARENIVYISIIDVCDGILKVLAALFLSFYAYDRLIAYSWIILGIMAFNLFALVIWARTHFDESMFLPRLSYTNKFYFKQLTGFAGWTIYSTACIVGRNQGIAVILNKFFGTIVNTSYGIAQQIFGAVMFISIAVANAISPQLIKAEGNGDRQRMLSLAESMSKYTFLLLSLIAIPLCFEMSAVLTIWLGDIPEHCILLCRFILITALCDQLTIGLGSANQAIGNIRNYSIVINTIKVLSLPFMWFLLLKGYGIVYAMWCYLIFECICALTRLPFLKYTAGLSISHFSRHVLFKLILPVCMQVGVSWLIVSTTESSFRFLLTGTVSCIVGIITIWFAGLESNERETAIQMFKTQYARKH